MNFTSIDVWFKKFNAVLSIFVRIRPNMVYLLRIIQNWLVKWSTALTNAELTKAAHTFTLLKVKCIFELWRRLWHTSQLEANSAYKSLIVIKLSSPWLLSPFFIFTLQCLMKRMIQSAWFPTSIPTPRPEEKRTSQ